jgi:hypothetical protein
MICIEAISKIRLRFKIKADSRFEPQVPEGNALGVHGQYVEDLKRESNTDIGLEDIFEMASSDFLRV